MAEYVIQGIVMTHYESSNASFSLPVFEVAQKPSPCDAQWSYEEAVRAFEEIALERRLRESPSSRQPLSEIPFKLQLPA
ncbi:MAG: hypothetical protein WCQ57_11205 [Verrucomicrobiota bacterium]